MRRIAWIAGAAIAAVAGALTYTVAQVQARAKGDVAEYLSGDPSRDRPIVCLGASIVRGRASVDFVTLLRQQMPHRTIVNAGVNGNVVRQVLDRLDDVLACNPADVVILVGTNDVLTSLTASDAEAEKSLADYRSVLDRVVQRLQEGGARVTLCSLPPLGQDLADAANARLGQFNSQIREVATARNTAYAPVHEALCQVLMATGETHGPAWSPSWRPGLESLIRHFVLGWSYDRIAERAGWTLTPDGVHLDSTGARIVADRVEECLVADQPRGA